MKKIIEYLQHLFERIFDLPVFLGLPILLLIVGVPCISGMIAVANILMMMGISIMRWPPVTMAGGRRGKR